MSLKNQQKIKIVLLVFAWAFLIFVRFYNLDWGLPFPFHPDERNIAWQVARLKCIDWETCLRPDFFAYGQLSLYTAFFLNQILLFFLDGVDVVNISFLSLRLVSAAAGVFTVYFLVKILRIYRQDTLWEILLVLLSAVVPVLVQFSHFGTTESLLGFFYTALVYFSLRFLHKQMGVERFIYLSALIWGAAVSSKVSAVFFGFVPLTAVFFRKDLRLQEAKIYWPQRLAIFLKIVILSFVISFLFSPYNFAAFEDFLNSMFYESSVAAGRIKVFYTQQFEYSLPILFQVFSIFPFALGFALSFFLIKSMFFWKQRIFLKIFFLIFFLSQSFLYTKWTRFLAPIYPIGALIAFFEIQRIKSRLLRLLIFILIFLQGAVFFKIYLQEDVRFQASAWMRENIPSDALVLQEIGNVVDLPVFKPNQKAGFDFKAEVVDLYEFENNPRLRDDVLERLRQADYFIVPSRRVFANYTCLLPKKEGVLPSVMRFLRDLSYSFDRCDRLQNDYPALHQFYQRIFEGDKFVLVSEFSSSPIFYDELSEETFSVFDHPVIRVYKRL